MIEEKVNSRAEYYKAKYGIIPGFKAGVHGGLAVTGELGYTKREIAYMGDVLNTTARIEEACKTFQKRLLVSEYLMTRLKFPPGIFASEVGRVRLRGKESELTLFSIGKLTD
jgi:adenylate cyclase